MATDRQQPDQAMRLNHVGIVVADLDVAHAFMTSVLGLQPSARQPEPNLRAAFYRCGPIEIQVVEDLDRLGSAPVGRLEHIAIDVDDLDALEKRLAAAGATLAYKTPKVYGDPPRFRTQFTTEDDASLGVKFQLTERFS